MQRKGKKKDGGKGWRKSGVSEGTLRSGVSREINSRSSSFVNFVAVRGLYYLVFPVRSASLYDSRGGIACEKERERREIKRKSGGRLLGRFLKGRKLCIANKRIGHGETPLREVICEFQGEIRLCAPPSSCLASCFLRASRLIIKVPAEVSGGGEAN